MSISLEPEARSLLCEARPDYYIVSSRVALATKRHSLSKQKTNKERGRIKIEIKPQNS